MEAPLSQLALNLGAATLMVAVTTLVHFFGLLGLTRIMSGAHVRLKTHAGPLRQASMILLVVFGIFALHTIEIWLYAALYRGLGELRTFEEALYFATVTFVSLGYGDIVLSPSWRVLSAIQAANGVILVAWSTAFLLTTTTRLRLLEHEWLEKHDKPAPPASD
ncbi:MAG: potassium channel family protein [Hyphomonadaceae bacterium]